MSKSVQALALVLTFAVCAPLSFAQQLTTAQVLSKLDEKAKVFSSLETSVSHTQYRDGLKYPTKPGKILIKVAKGVPRFFWDVTEPKEERMRILIDKGELKAYFPNTNTYQIERVNDTEMVELLLIGFGVPATTLTRNYKPEVKGRESVGGLQAVVLELTSISTRTTKFPKVTLWLDPQTWTPVRTRVTEVSRDYTDFDYSKTKLNKGVSDSAFNLKIPSNAKKQ